MQIFVCVTCRTADEPAEPKDARSGARLFRALAAAASWRDGLEVVPVECLSVCKRPCTISFAASGKWTYVYGDLPPDTAAATILEGAALYAGTPDGIIPWKLRPEPLKRGVVARVPPLPSVASLPAAETLESAA
jgi:predicted metal-binding protein